MSVSKFKLDTTILPPIHEDLPSTGHLFSSFQLHSDAPVHGKYQQDSESGKYNLEWSSLEEFQVWLRKEQEEKCIELRRAKKKIDGKGKGGEHFYYVCARHGTGGIKRYEKKNPDWNRKIPTKRTNCPCRLVVKKYPEVTNLRGYYKEEHDHPIGRSNVRFTRITTEMRIEIAEMLRVGLQPKVILPLVQGRVHSDWEALKETSTRREHFIDMADIMRIKKGIDAEKIRLHRNDGESTLQWVERLRKGDALLAFKGSCDPAPKGSNLASDTFVVVIQTNFQREMFEKYGPNFAGIDATHNTTQYENMNLFTVLVRDSWGHGVPISWMISSNATELTVDYFLMLLRSRNPCVVPKHFMTDDNAPQSQLSGVRYYSFWRGEVGGK